jgi:flagellar protein FlaD
MVLGLIDFLLGGKKKNKVSRSGQVASPMRSGQDSDVEIASGGNEKIPDGKANPTENAEEMNFVSSKSESEKQEEKEEKKSVKDVDSQTEEVHPASRKGTSVSEALNKLYKELKNTNNRVAEIVSEVKNAENAVNTLGNRIDELEEAKKANDEKMEEIDGNMNKFLSLYELINNQYSPFVDKEQSPKIDVEKEMKIDAEGKQICDENNKCINVKDVDLSKAKEDKDMEILLELDTLNIEKAAGDAVPLNHLKNNTNSLVIILSWLEYMIKRVGVVETRENLRYYTEILRWITPEVFFDLDRYLKGMKDPKQFDGSEKMDIKDHIVSLYFISKLNEKALDHKLTKAVLQIIKEQ